jgi:diaminohydroxyphosphoribosylaminopyrimidine deaminase/5-amino-6-(5-phosphoribosylamino)uracil reductase
LDLRWLLKHLGAENVTSLLVEGGGEVNATFLLGGFAQRVAFFYAPKILDGRDSRKAVAGEGAKSLSEVVHLREIGWQRLGEDLLLTARVGTPNSGSARADREIGVPAQTRLDGVPPHH